MSDTDIPSGKLWADKIRNGLLESNFGIICLTPENLINPWLLFEAGALSKFNESFVVPYVYDMKPSEIPFPLAMYQGETANEGGTRKLLDSIQLALGNLGLKQEILEEAFKTSWPDLKSTLAAIGGFGIGEEVFIVRGRYEGLQGAVDQRTGAGNDVLYHVKLSDGRSVKVEGEDLVRVIHRLNKDRV